MLKCLSISNFRNFKYFDLNLHAKCSFIYGLNGSGKTSLLEAIYFLFLGKSFRTRLTKNLIYNGTNEFQIGGLLHVNDEELRIGTLRNTDGVVHLRKNGNRVRTQGEIARLLPIQLFNHESFLLLTDPSKIRRKFIDWGIFYLKPDFLKVWHDFDKILKQRNEQIRQDFIPLWDKGLAKLGEQLHLMRLEYLNEFLPFAVEILRELLPNLPLNIDYFPGWDTNLPLLSVLNDQRKVDLRFGYTMYGPHRADLLVLLGDKNAKDYLSRGQQKILVYGLQLAQGLFLQIKGNNQKCLYLIDDPLAEMDLLNYQLLMRKIYNTGGGQIVLTGLKQGNLKCMTDFFGDDFLEYDLSNV